MLVRASTLLYERKSVINEFLGFFQQVAQLVLKQRIRRDYAGEEVAQWVRAFPV